MTGFIVCDVCGKEFERDRPHGRAPKRCSPECRKEGKKRQARKKNKKYYEENREYFLEYSRRYRESHQDERREWQKNYYQENREKLLAEKQRYHRENRTARAEYNRKYYEENKERILESDRKYRQREHDRIAKRKRAYYEENIEHIRNYHREYRSKNMDKILESCHRRDAKKRDAFVEDVNILVLLEESDWTCGICGGDIPKEWEKWSPLTPHIDHIVPLSKGGEHSYVNTQAAHSSCNIQKGDKLDGWQDIKPYVRKGGES